MATRATQSFSFPVISFRHLETPFEREGIRDYFAIVSVRQLPDLSRWRKINVRDPKLTGTVPQSIRDAFHDQPKNFVFMNRGMVIAVNALNFNNKTSELTIDLRDPLLHGLLDGGHTYDIVRNECEQTPGLEQYVRVEFLQGFDTEDITSVVDARNTSNQVRDQSLMNLQGDFNPLKDALKGKPYAESIAYKEFEYDKDGDPKPIDVREVISILTVFDRDHFDDATHPINSYRSKSACLNHFKEHKKSYEKIYPIADDILRLYDTIQLHLPRLYNTTKDGGKFGKLTGVKYTQGRKNHELNYLGVKSEYGVPTGFLFPLLGAFRALIEDNGMHYAWINGVDPLKLFSDGEIGKLLAQTIGSFALENRNPSKTGKSIPVWSSCYAQGLVESMKLRSRRS